MYEYRRLEVPEGFAGYFAQIIQAPQSITLPVRS